MSQQINKILKKKFLDIDTTRCEYPNCNSEYGLTFAHRHKRRFYTNKSMLTDLNQVVLLCLKHHMLIEYDKQATIDLFNKLRGRDIL